MPALGDIKIADFTWVVSGPLCTRYLADFGAQVVHVETSRHIDPARTIPPYKDNQPGINRGGYFHNWNCNKLGITLNLGHPKGVEVARRLISWADVVAENFSPGVMDRLGIGYEAIRKFKPDVIMLSLSSKGAAGPYSDLPAVGMHLAALSGFVHIAGWPDRDPVLPFGAYTDSIAGRFGAIALLAAIDYRHRTGQGQYIDLSQYEAAIQFLVPPLLDFEVNQRVLGRSGNRLSFAAPHGAFRCRGEDRWCAIAVSSDAEWEALCDVMGRPAWTKEDRFGSLWGRKAHEEELERRIEAWTVNMDAEEVMRVLQEAGVPAAVVATAEGLHSDPQLQSRQHYRKLEHGEIGLSTYDSMGSSLSKSPAELHKAAHMLGEDNYEVYTQLLGMPDDEFVSLLEEGVFD